MESRGTTRAAQRSASGWESAKNSSTTQDSSPFSPWTSTFPERDREAISLRELGSRQPGIRKFSANLRDIRLAVLIGKYAANGIPRECPEDKPYRDSPGIPRVPAEILPLVHPVATQLPLASQESVVLNGRAARAERGGQRRLGRRLSGTSDRPKLTCYAAELPARISPGWPVARRFHLHFRPMDVVTRDETWMTERDRNTRYSAGRS